MYPHGMYTNEVCVVNQPQLPDGGSKDVTCTQPITGRYVFVVTPLSEVLTLCEVQVWSRACSLCPAHSSSPQASTAVTACICNAGFSGPDGAGFSGLDGGPCAACSAGKYKTNSGSVGSTNQCTGTGVMYGTSITGEFAATGYQLPSDSTKMIFIFYDKGTYYKLTSVTISDALVSATPTSPTDKYVTMSELTTLDAETVEKLWDGTYPDKKTRERARGTGYEVKTVSVDCCDSCPANSISPPASTDLAGCTACPSNSGVTDNVCVCNAGFSGSTGASQIDWTYDDYGVRNPTITKGVQVTVNWPKVGVANHPFNIGLAQAGTDAEITQAPSFPVQIDAAAQTTTFTIPVDYDGPDLYYHCDNHVQTMGKGHIALAEACTACPPNSDSPSGDGRVKALTGEDGWRLVRYLPAGSTNWHPVDDAVVGTGNLAALNGVSTPAYTDSTTGHVVTPGAWGIPFGVFDEIFISNEAMDSWVQFTSATNSIIATSVAGSLGDPATCPTPRETYTYKDLYRGYCPNLAWSSALGQEGLTFDQCYQSVLDGNDK